MLPRILVLLLALVFRVFDVHAEPLSLGETYTLRSMALSHEERTFRVALPPSYGWAKERRYPVLYLLDGKAHFGHTVGSAGYLAAQGEIPEMIVVGIDSTVRVRDFTPTDWSEAWVGGGGAGNFKKFLSKELIPKIEADYRTDGFRVLAGHSASGQFALYCLTEEPELFHSYIALSPQLEWDHNLPQRALEASFVARKAPLPNFLYVARSDDAGRALADYQALIGTLMAKSPPGFRWQSRAFPEETHGSIALPGLIDALRAVYPGYRFHGDMAPLGVAHAETQYRRLSELLGRPMPIPEAVLDELGYFALSEKKFDEAIALLQRNAAAYPTSPNASDSLADAYAEAKRLAEALAAAEEALARAQAAQHPRLAYFTSRVAELREQLAAKED